MFGSPLSLFSEEAARRYNRYLHAYGDLLYQWGLVNQRLEVLKFLANEPTALQQPGSMRLHSGLGMCARHTDDSAQRQN